MLKRKDQDLLSEAYGQVGVGSVGAPSMMGKPVMITMDMPGTEVDTKGNSNENLETSSDEMVVSDLHKIAKHALEIHNAIKQGKALEAWEISKITKAAVNISDVYDALEYGDCEEDSTSMYDKGYEDECECPYAEEGCTCGGCPDCQP
jgi:hypothetical protein